MPSSKLGFDVNGNPMLFEGDAGMPLLWYLRDYAKLSGTKYGCGIGECGACTVHVDGIPMRSCQLPIGQLQGKKITTIEGLADGSRLHVLQQAWIDEDVAQCGFCQSGQLMAAAALLEENTSPSDKDIATITNICRCGTYPRIRRAIKRAASQLPKGKKR